MSVVGTSDNKRVLKWKEERLNIENYKESHSQMFDFTEIKRYCGLPIK